MRLPIILLLTIPVVWATPVEKRAEGTWTISDFSWCSDQSMYDYSFKIKGTANGKTTAFKGTCSGTNDKVYLECTYDPKPIKDFNLFAKTKKVNGNPEVKIMTWYIDTSDDCKYIGKGSITIDDATCAGNSGEKYRIAPKDSKDCNSVAKRAHQGDGTWTISHISWCRDQSNYAYNFKINGTANGKTPAFRGTCSGTNGKIYYQCTSHPSGGQNFNLFAKTKVKNGNPVLKIQTDYIDAENGCRYTADGGIEIIQWTCAGKSDVFRIGPANSKDCS